MRYVSPLRYPGGKGGLAEFLGRVIELQRPVCKTYVEPYAGGAGAALRLLVGEYVDDVIINDLDRGIAAFWRCVFEKSDEFIDLVQSADLTIDEWHRQVDIHRSSATNELDLGFATFYLNRTNRSGIMDAGPIGGLDQIGHWLLDARFNRDDLSHRIRTLSKYRNRVTISQQDGCELLSELLPDSRATFFYVDPPYVDKGRDLYLNDLTWCDHEKLAAVLQDNNARWLVTYNCDNRISNELYPGRRCVRFDIAHTAQHQHVGSELAIFADSLVLGSLEALSKGAVTFMSA